MRVGDIVRDVTEVCEHCLHPRWMVVLHERANKLDTTRCHQSDQRSASKPGVCTLCLRLWTRGRAQRICHPLP
jgi:hypothetical protein